MQAHLLFKLLLQLGSPQVWAVHAEGSVLLQELQMAAGQANKP